ncbi:DUF3878 family protein [Blautia sp. MSJ-19]|uniref:DUF3878 family protein n=1 Tax=Blautia sp. MSJ-19 TaxID=2841517 RepID=UPI001C0F2C13|nr:DUF3878 family protein [Blautia sp. MSJ-19]MBU5482582.1 DUF3878 family protein [Blautia sp. MSJ-19]
MTEETLEKLAQLLEQDQFELLIPEHGQANEIGVSGEKQRGMDARLVYLMNDAVESFLVLRNARMTGEYHSDYQGELQASMTRQDGEYVLVVKQGDTVLTLFFEELDLEVHLYEYAYTGHFWVEEYEYLRQLEYRLAILRDKYDYLGEEYCTEGEKKLAALVEFPPLNYCCYPAVPEKYIVPRENPWIPSEKAIEYMKELAAECGDVSFGKMLEFYKKHPAKFWAKRLAVMLHQAKHSAIIDLLTKKIQEATAEYSKRFWGDDLERKYQRTLEKVKERQTELEKQGIHADILREEPFTIARDSLDYKLYLMIWKKKKGNRITEIEEYACKEL